MQNNTAIEQPANAMRINNGLQHYIRTAGGPFELRTITVATDASSAFTELDQHILTYPASVASRQDALPEPESPPDAYQPWYASDEPPSAEDDARSAPASEINDKQNQREKRAAEVDQSWNASNDPPSAEDDARSVPAPELHNYQIQ
jgi:hypothetical protein